MAGWPTQEAVDRALAVLAVADEGDGESDPLDLTRATLLAAGLPELMGSSQVAAELGIATGNLDKVKELPEPLYSPESGGPSGGRLFDADAIRALAARRRAAA